MHTDEYRYNLLRYSLHTDRYIQDAYSQYLVCICTFLLYHVCIMSVFAQQNLLVGYVQTDTDKYMQIHTTTDKIKLRDTDKYIHWQIHAYQCTLKPVFKSLFLFYLDSISMYHVFICISILPSM